MAKELQALARQSPAVCDALVRIVEHWPCRRKWLACYSLALLAVGKLIVQGKLSPDLRSLAVHGMVESWFRAGELMWSEGDGDAQVAAIADQILENLAPPFNWLRDRKPAVLLWEYYRRLCDDPDSVRRHYQPARWVERGGGGDHGDVVEV